MSDPQSSSTNWFGSLQLAYKYIVVFCGLLVLVFVAGLIKVLFDRRKLKKFAKKEELEAGPKDDTVELNQREKDEGDLFGIRAIEAGFYAGVAQSRPTSRAGSVIGHPTMSSSTLVGGSVNSPLMKGQSANTSVLSLNLGQDAGSRRASPPNMKLRPSEAELTGKHGAVDMSLQVPPSPGIPRGPTSPTGSDDGFSDGFTTPRHYAPAPTISMPDALQATYHDAQDNNAKSQVASFNSSPATSPTPPPPGNPPATRLPTLPSTALRKESRSPSPEYNYPQVRVEHSTTEPAQSSTVPTPPPQTLASTHKRDASDASSMYSQTRLSTFDAYQAYQKQAGRTISAASDSTFNFSSTDGSRRTSLVAADTRPSQPETHLTAPSPADLRLSLAPSTFDPSRLSVAPNGQEQRLSEFYDAYYRNSNSQISPVQTLDAKRVVGRHSTIVEVDTPLASPMFPKAMQHAPPGAAF